MKDPIKNLLVLAGILAAITVVVLINISIGDQFGYTLRDPTTANGSASTQATLLINTSVAFGTTNQYPFLQEVTGCVNASNASDSLNTGYYTIIEGSSSGGYIRLSNLAWNNTGINCTSISYLKATTNSGVADVFIAGLALFGTFAGILVLAIIGKTIIGMFKKTE